MTCADASLWISYLLPDDVHHQESRAWFHQLMADAELVEPTFLLVEITAGLSRRVTDYLMVERIVASVRSDPRLILVSMTDERMEAARKLAGQLRLRAGDAVYVALAAERAEPLVTWDREQRERSEGVIRVTTPADDLVGM